MVHSRQERHQTFDIMSDPTRSTGEFTALNRRCAIQAAGHLYAFNLQTISKLTHQIHPITAFTFLIQQSPHPESPERNFATQIQRSRSAVPLHSLQASSKHQASESKVRIFNFTRWTGHSVEGVFKVYLGVCRLLAALHVSRRSFGVKL